MCYPHGGHNPQGYAPKDLAHGRYQKCQQHGCHYLLFGDGQRVIKTEYFPVTEPYPYVT